MRIGLITSFMSPILSALRKAIKVQYVGVIIGGLRLVFFACISINRNRAYEQQTPLDTPKDGVLSSLI